MYPSFPFNGKNFPHKRSKHLPNDLKLSYTILDKDTNSGGNTLIYFSFWLYSYNIKYKSNPISILYGNSFTQTSSCKMQFRPLRVESHIYLFPCKYHEKVETWLNFLFAWFIIIFYILYYNIRNLYENSIFCLKSGFKYY